MNFLLHTQQLVGKLWVNHEPKSETALHSTEHAQAEKGK